MRLKWAFLLLVGLLPFAPLAFSQMDGVEKDGYTKASQMDGVGKDGADGVNPIFRTSDQVNFRLAGHV